MSAAEVTHPIVDDSSDWDTSSASSGSSSSGSESCDEVLRICANCSKTETQISRPLKRCAKCHDQRYCSRECQTSDWKVHKKSCGKTQQSNPAASAGPKLAGDFLQGMGNEDYLYQFSQKDAFCQLIDCYRLRVEDDYTFDGDTRGLYNEENPLPDFRRFLNKAEKRKGILPKWWSPAKRKECERMAVRGGGWSDINCAVEKSDVVEHYGDPLMPMNLRMLGEKIYGERVGMGLGGW